MNHKPDRFIDSLCAEAFDSAAVNHPYLRAIHTGDLPNIDLALKDFAFHYGLYSARFTHYVSAVTAKLSKAEHKQILLANLAEEQGDTEGVELPSDVLASIVGLPHSSLYRRFQQAMGVDAEYAKAAQRCQTSVLWSQKFLELCKMNEYVGVGAIGIGTELIVSRIYNKILEGLKAHSNLTMIERVFFDLHSQCDEEHAAQMLMITRDLAQDSTSRKKIEYGARLAIDLRVTFWDQMLQRAQSFPAPEIPVTERVTVAKKATALAN